MTEKSASRVTQLLDFFKLPYRVSASNEVELDCLKCGKEKHLYATEVEGKIVWNCKVCGAGGGEDSFIDILIRRAVDESTPDREYWGARGIPAEVQDELRLGYSSVFNRYTIPYHGPSGYCNLSLRSADGIEPRYLRLPSVAGVPYLIGVEAGNVVLTEGEIDAISAYVLLKDHPKDIQIVGLPGADFAKKKVLSQFIGKNVVAVCDNDKAGSKAARKILDVLPGATIASLPTGIKDLNELLVSGSSDATQVLLSALNESPESKKAVGPVTMREFLSQPPKDSLWMIDDLLAQDALAILAGRPKTKKSLLSLYLAYQVAEGQKFLGRQIRRPGPTLVINQEDSERVLFERLQKLSSSGSLNLHLLIPAKTGWNVKFSDADSMYRLEQYIQELQPALVVIDPLANAIGALDENNASEVNRLMETVRHLRDRYKCAIVLVHHTRKSAEDEQTGYALRGSSVFFAKAESLLLLSDGSSGHTKLTSIQKSGTSRTFDLAFNDGEFELLDEGGVS